MLSPGRERTTNALALNHHSDVGYTLDTSPHIRTNSKTRTLQHDELFHHNNKGEEGGKKKKSSSLVLPAIGGQELKYNELTHND